MKALILISLLITGNALACSCEYDYGAYSKSFMNRAANLIKDVKGDDLHITNYEIKYTAMAYMDPTSYGRHSCGCTSFVKRVWNITYTKSDKACEAEVVLNVWNDKMKVKNINCN